LQARAAVPDQAAGVRKSTMMCWACQVHPLFRVYACCPTNALQADAFEAGIEGFGAPILIPRMGYCEFSCNTCGQVCPVQAIPH